jgi:hypothetical protein
VGDEEFEDDGKAGDDDNDGDDGVFGIAFHQESDGLALFDKALLLRSECNRPTLTANANSPVAGRLVQDAQCLPNRVRRAERANDLQRKSHYNLRSSRLH